MKKLTGLIIIALALLMALTAFAAPGDVTIYSSVTDPENERGVNSSRYVFLNDQLFMTSYRDMRKLYSVSADGSGVWTEYTLEEGIIAEEDPDEEIRENMEYLLSDGESLYALVVAMEYGEDYSMVDGAYLRKLSIGEGNSISLEEETELDWSDMVEGYDDYEYTRYMESPFIMDGYFCCTSYALGGGGQEFIWFDISSGDMYTHSVENLRYAFPYKDGKALFVSISYSSDREVKMYAFDMGEEEAEELGVLALSGNASPTAFVYHEANDSVYFIFEGELFACPLSTMQAQAVAAMNLDYSESMPIMTNDGFFIAGDYSTIIRRNTDPSMRAETRITVVQNYDMLSEKAAMEFEKAHPDVELIVKNYQTDIITAMMSRSSDIDVYVLSTSSGDYQALFKRGYMADLSDIEEINALVNSMYPNLAAAISKDGKIYALPVYLDSYSSFSIHSDVFEKLGFAQSDIPDTWDEFLTLLETLPEVLEEYPEIKAFEAYYSAPDMRMQMVHSLYQDYLLYILTDEKAEKKMDTPVMRGLLERIEKLDFEALGLMSDYGEEEDESVFYYDYDPDKVLFETYGFISPTRSGGPKREVLVLSITEGAAPRIQASMQVSFVNPYSKNLALAKEYVRLQAQAIEEDFRIQLSPADNQPILNPNYEQVLESYDETIESLKKTLEQMEDDAEKLEYQQMIEDYIGYRDEYEKDSKWNATEESIAQYQKKAQCLTVYVNLAVDEEASEAIYTALMQYQDGAISAQEMLKAMDKKLTMILLEGV